MKFSNLILKENVSSFKEDPNANFYVEKITDLFALTFTNGDVDKVQLLVPIQDQFGYLFKIFIEENSLPVFHFSKSGDGIGLYLSSKDIKLRTLIKPDKGKNVEAVIEEIEKIFSKIVKPEARKEIQKRFSATAKSYVAKIFAFLKSKKLEVQFEQSAKYVLKNNENSFSLEVPIVFTVEEGVDLVEGEANAYSIMPSFVYKLDKNEEVYFPGFISPVLALNYEIPSDYKTAQDFEENAFNDFIRMFEETVKELEKRREEGWF